MRLSDNIETALQELPEIEKLYAVHVSEADWGDSILLMSKGGTAFGRLYWFHDDNDTVYLDWLSVEKNCRRIGRGTYVQEAREKIGRKLGAKEVCLWVKKDSWMHDWYKRRGYADWKDNEEYEGTIWMKKSLI